MSPGVATFLFEAANFVLLAAVLGWAFFHPVQRAIEARREALEAERRATEAARAEVERRLAAVDARRREAEASFEPLRAMLRRDAEKEAARLVDAGRRRAEEERASLQAELASLRRAHAAALARDAASATRVLVERLLAEVGGPDLELALVRACASRLPAGSASGAGIVLVESARALSEDASKILAQALGAGAPAPQVRVLPELVGGVRVTTGGGMVDASIAGLAAEVVRELAVRLEAGEPGDATHG